jgi:hypothetical protein
MFFILFVNDYPRCLKYSNVTIYADDTSQDITDKSVDIMETKLICETLLHVLNHVLNQCATLKMNA